MLAPLSEGLRNLRAAERGFGNEVLSAIEMIDQAARQLRKLGLGQPKVAPLGVLHAVEQIRSGISSTPSRMSTQRPRASASRKAADVSPPGLVASIHAASPSSICFRRH